jgi:hypothetical protein
MTVNVFSTGSIYLEAYRETLASVEWAFKSNAALSACPINIKIKIKKIKKIKKK